MRAVFILCLVLLVPGHAQAWDPVAARLITREADVAQAYYKDPNGFMIFRAPISLQVYTDLPTTDGEPLPRHPSIPADWIWLGAGLAAQFDTPTHDLRIGDVAVDSLEIRVETPDGIRGLLIALFTVSTPMDKVHVDPDPPDFKVRNGVMAQIGGGP